MSWYTPALTSVFGWITSAFQNKDFQTAGVAVLNSIAADIKAAIGDSDELKKIAGTLITKAPEIIGSIAANTPAAALVDPQYMPPNSTPAT